MEEVSAEEWRKVWVPNWPVPAVNMLLDAWAAAVGQPALVTSAVKDVTGVAARTFLEWSRDHSGSFQK